MNDLTKNWRRVKRALVAYMTNDEQQTAQTFKRDTDPLLGLKIKICEDRPAFTVESILVCPSVFCPGHNNIYVAGIMNDSEWDDDGAWGPYCGILLDNSNDNKITWLGTHTTIGYLTLEPELDKFKAISGKMISALVSEELER